MTTRPSTPTQTDSVSTEDDICQICPDGQDEKEQAIVAAARRTFLAKGFDAASMDTIALEAGVSKRTVYNRFRSKEALFAAAILATCQRILPQNFEEIEHNLPPKALLTHLATSFVHGIFDEEAIALRRIAAFEASRTPALGKAYLDNGPRLMVRACVPILQRLATRTDHVDIEDPERALWQLGALLTEPLYTWVLMGERPDNLEELLTEQIDQGLNAFLRLYKIS